MTKHLLSTLPQWSFRSCLFKEHDGSVFGLVLVHPEGHATRTGRASTFEVTGPYRKDLTVLEQGLGTEVSSIVGCADLSRDVPTWRALAADHAAHHQELFGVPQRLQELEKLILAEIEHTMTRNRMYATCKVNYLDAWPLNKVLDVEATWGATILDPGTIESPSEAGKVSKADMGLRSFSFVAPVIDPRQITKAAAKKHKLDKNELVARCAAAIEVLHVSLGIPTRSD